MYSCFVHARRYWMKRAEKECIEHLQEHIREGEELLGEISRMKLR